MMPAPPASCHDACVAAGLWKGTFFSTFAFPTAGCQNVVRQLFRESIDPARVLNGRSRDAECGRRPRAYAMH